MALRAVVRVGLAVERRVPHADLNFISLITACVETDTNSVVNAPEVVRSVITSGNEGNDADRLQFIASEATDFEAFRCLGISWVSVGVETVAATFATHRVRNVVAEDLLAIIVTSMSWCNESSIHTTGCDVILEDYIISRHRVKV